MSNNFPYNKIKNRYNYYNISLEEEEILEEYNSFF